MRTAPRLVDYGSTRSLGFRLRRRRGRLIRQLVESICSGLGRRIRLVDLGGTEIYWKILQRSFLERHVERISLVNLEHRFVDDTELFVPVVGDACALSAFADHEFDLVHSNSVIEHVGDMSRMERFAAEVARLAPCYYIQTPYFWFPVEPHFLCPLFHWLPESIRVRLALRVALGNYPRMHAVETATKAVRGIRLLDRREMRVLFPGACHRFEWFAGFPKSLIAYRAPSS